MVQQGELTRGQRGGSSDEEKWVNLRSIWEIELAGSGDSLAIRSK